MSACDDHIHWGGGECHDPHRLTVKDLHVHYGKLCALENISFSTSCGNAVALLGANGAGKSTLLKVLAGLLPNYGGVIEWKGEPLTKASHEIAYLPQRESVDWNFPITVRGMVEMGCYPQLGMWRKFGKHESEIVDRAVASMRLEDLQHRQISALSGGQQQRAFIARALAQEAHVLLLDEPFTGLDKPSRETLSELMKELVAEGRLVIASHHDLNTVQTIFDQALLLRREVVAYGPPEEVLDASTIERVFA